MTYPATDPGAARILGVDEALLIDVLGLPKGSLDVVATARRQWCIEPTVQETKDRPNPHVLE